VHRPKSTRNNLAGILGSNMARNLGSKQGRRLLLPSLSRRSGGATAASWLRRQVLPG
jgi:hypothetical protein